MIGVTYRWHIKLQSHYSMIRRWSFHPPHDPEKVVINEGDNKYFSFKPSFRLSNSKTFELKDISEYFDDEAKSNSSQVPDLVLDLEESETELMSEEDTQVVPQKVFFRKPSKYVRPKLSLVEEEDDEGNLTAVSSVRSSVRGSMVVHHELSDSD